VKKSGNDWLPCVLSELYATGCRVTETSEKAKRSNNYPTRKEKRGDNLKQGGPGAKYTKSVRDETKRRLISEKRS